MARYILALLLVISACYVFSADSARAGFVTDIPDGDCAVAIVKVTPQVESASFEFVQSLNGVDTQFTLLSNQMTMPDFEFIGQGETVTFTELPTDGWTLEEIQCFQGPGVEITKTEDSVIFECTQPVSEVSVAFCGFFNRVSADKIPTLSEWGMIAAAAGLGLVGVFFAVRRRRLQAGA